MEAKTKKMAAVESVIKKEAKPCAKVVIDSFVPSQIWNNPLLAWNSTEFGGLKSINVSPKKVWLPDIVLYEK